MLHIQFDHRYACGRHADSGGHPLTVTGPWAGNTVAFKNPDGSVAVILQNPFDEARTIHVQLAGRCEKLTLPPKSVSTLARACEKTISTTD